MMKKIIATVLAILTLTCALAACSQAPADTSQQAENQNGQTAQNNNSAAEPIAQKPEAKQDAEVKILSSAIGSDYAGNPILIIEYEFINHTDKAASFTLSVTDKAYQNGVECNSLVICDEIDAQQALNDVKPETPYTLKVGYALQDTTSAVEIEITDLFGTNTYLSQTIALS